MDESRSASSVNAVDHAMMERCIALAMRAVDFGEYPYAALICRDDKVVCERFNAVTQDRDVTHHAEVVAISEAQHRLRSLSWRTAPSTSTPSLAPSVAMPCASPASDVSYTRCRLPSPEA